MSAWLADVVAVCDTHPVVETRTSAPIKSKGNAYLSGVLIYRFSILAIGFVFIPPSFCSSRDFTPLAWHKRWVVEMVRDSLNVVV